MIVIKLVIIKDSAGRPEATGQAFPLDDGGTAGLLADVLPATYGKHYRSRRPRS
jgi:hypothetical protein